MKCINCCFSKLVKPAKRGTLCRLTVLSAALLVLGAASVGRAEIYSIRQIGNQVTVNGVTINVSDAGVNGAGRHLVDFTFRNIVGSDANAVSDVWFDDESGNPAGSALVLDTFTIENGPGVSFSACGSGSIPNGNGVCPQFSRNFCASRNGGNSNAINQGEYLITHFTLKAGKTIDDVKFWLLQQSTNTACTGTELPALRIAMSAGLNTGGASSGINNPTPFPPEDCNQNGIPDVCDLDCNGFNGQCQIFVGVCGQGLPPVAPPTNIQANPTSICPGATSTLTATVAAGQTLEWFSGSCGGQLTPIHIGSPFVTDPLSATTSFFARAKNASGCTSNCVSVTVTVVDTQAPVITTCPPAQSSDADANCQAAVPNFVPGVVATDNCTPAGSLTITQSPTAGTVVGTGVTNVTITVADALNNQTTCQTTFTVTDNTPPTITQCAAPQSASANGACQATVPDFRNGVIASDNCVAAGSLTRTQNPAPGTLVGLGVHTVTIFVSDGPTPPRTAVSCDTTFTVADTTAPTITSCAGDQSAAADATCQAAVPDFTSGVSASDNCTPAGSLTITQSPAAGTLVGTGVTPVTITVKDAANNSITCQAAFTVSDTSAPTILACANDQSAAADANCQASVPDFTSGVSASDNCTPAGSLTKTQSPAAGTLVGTGITPVTITVKDAANNAAACQATFTVSDTSAPAILSCANNQSADANANCQAPVPDFASGVSASDNCTPAGSLTKTQVPPAGTLVGTGVTTVTITVKDAADNSTTCEATFTVTDVTAPTITICPTPVTAFADANCNALLPDFTPFVVASDNCTSSASLIITQVPPAGTVVGLGLTNVTITVSDGVNQSTCQTSITVVDNTAPAIEQCAAPQSIPADSETCQAQLPSLTGLVVATDNCPPVSVTQNPVAGTTLGLGATPVTITVTDPSNNQSTCPSSVTVVDVTPPFITSCAGDQSASADETCQAPVPDFTNGVVAGDNCTGTNSLTITQSPTAGTLVALGITPVTITVTDAANNSSTCQAMFTVNDDTPPTITECANNQSASAGETCQAPVPDFTSDVSATDNCTPPGGLSVTQVPPAGTLVGSGDTNVTITVKDGANNIATCLATFTVTDSTSPTIVVCPQGASAQADANCQAAVPDLTPGVLATDNCTPSGSLVITQSPAAGTLVGTGVTPVIITVKDGANNIATCETTFTVSDVSAPTIVTCADDASATANQSCQAAVPDFTSGVVASDNCTPAGSLTKTQSPAAGTLVGIGTHTVIITVSDGAIPPNEATCQATFTVTDNMAPVVNCPANITVSNELGKCGAVVTYEASASDSCAGGEGGSIPVTCVMPSGSFFPIGTTQVTCTATDAAQNIGTCTFNVTVTGSCSDGNPCTIDTCDPETHVCIHTPIANCCSQPADCDDEDPCTADSCSDNHCVHTPIDTDGDGVPDCSDQCPGTPAGQPVNSAGCSCSQLDDDGDGVNNCNDQCPGTPAGTQVGADGCPPAPPGPQPTPCDQLDSDGDGVNDCDDQCPDTPAGTNVRADGCPVCGSPKSPKVNILFSNGWLAPVCGSGCPIMIAALACGLATLRSGFRRRRYRPGGRKTGNA